jgi:serine/threonine protein kinase
MGDERASESRVIGKVLAGKYRIDGFLKRGGMGAVYRGTHLMLGKPVAIKLINPELVTSADIVDRFQREAKAAANLTHPNIVIVHDLGQTTEGELYIAMELVGGRSLKQVIKEDGPMDPARAVRLMKAMCSALALAHRNGVIHRDLKPQNIMITEDSEGNEMPKILDFGIAKTFEPDSTALTATGTVIGTPQYMSPEQAKGMAVDMRSDLYSLGIILYEMLVGKVPFDDSSVPAVLVKHLSEMPAPPRQLRSDLSPAIEAVVLRTLEKDPEKRFQSAEELSRGLEQALSGATPPPTPIPATENNVPTVAETAVMGGATPKASTRPTVPVGQAPSPRPPDSRTSNRGLWIGLAALVVLLVLGALWLMSPRGPEKVTTAEVEAPTGEPAAANNEPSSSHEAAPSPPVEPAEPVEEAATSEPVPVPAPPATTSARPVVDPPPAQTEPVVAEEPEPAAVEPLPKNPPVYVACDGLSDACASVTSALRDAIERDRMSWAPESEAEVLISIFSEEIESRSETQFGTTFVTRTYSMEARVSVPRFGDVAMPPPEVFSFDTRFGRDKLDERTRVLARNVTERVRRYWNDRVGPSR